MKMNRERDLGNLALEVGGMLVADGHDASQVFHDWKRIEQIEADSNRGGGNGGAVFDEVDRAGDRKAAKRSREWLEVRVQLQHHLDRAKALMDEAKRQKVVLADKHRTPAQVEADGWCGHHWRLIGTLEAVTLRPTGEPFYRGKCRWCGDNNPDAEMLRARHEGKPLRVRV
jgi:hypothetical protein